MKKTTKNMTKSILTVFMASFMFACSVGCAPSADSSSSAGTEGTGYEIFGVASTEKVLQETSNLGLVEKRTAEVDVDMAKGEYEAAQLVISAAGKVSSYDVTVSDLTSEDGEVFAKANITVYSAKYTNVLSAWNQDSPTGMYPDALLPFDKAKEYKENYVEAGDTQTLYISFRTTTEQATGTYNGQLKITVDGEENTVPVRLRVRNVAVSEAVHNKSIFLNEWQYYLGEYGDTQELLDAYHNKLIEYRLAPNVLVVDTNGSKADAEYYAEKAYEIAANDRCSNFTIPAAYTTQGIVKDRLYMYIIALAEKSLETQYDLLKKAYVYGIDEPVANGMYDTTKKFAETFEAQKEQAATELEKKKAEYLAANPQCDEAFFDGLVASIRGIRNVVTTAYSEAYEPYVDTWCPTFKDYEITADREHYIAAGEQWFYGCLQPKAPYPTYQICDTLLSARMVGWLQAIYGVTGNLYWGTNIYAKYDGTYKYLDDYYNQAAHFTSVNGDGYLFYPGKKYGMDEPLASTRLETIRDGYEEYELLYAIQEQYKAVGEQIGENISADTTIANLASALYTGTQITATHDTFKAARTQLLNLSEFTQSGICFTDYSDNGKGLLTYKLYVPSGVTLTATGVEKTSVAAVTGGEIQTFQVDMQTSTATKAVFSTTLDGETLSVEYVLPGKVDVYDASTLQTNFDGIVASESVLTDASTLEEGEEGQWFRFSFAQNETTTAIHKTTFTNETVLSAITTTAQKATFRFYYAGTEPLNVKVSVKYKSDRYASELMTIVLQHGFNEINWENIDKTNWTKKQGLENIIFRIGNAGDGARNDLYLIGLSVYRKGGN